MMSTLRFLLPTSGDMLVTANTIIVALRAMWSATADKDIRGAVRQSSNALPSDQRWTVFVDLQEIELVTSSVLGLLVILCSQANQSGGKMAVANVSGLACEMMQRLTLAELWLIAESVSDATLAVEKAP